MNIRYFMIPTATILLTLSACASDIDADSPDEGADSTSEASSTGCNKAAAGKTQCRTTGTAVLTCKKIGGQYKWDIVPCPSQHSSDGTSKFGYCKDRDVHNQPIKPRCALTEVSEGDGDGDGDGTPKHK